MKYQGTKSATLELKREIPKYDQIIKTVIGFSNQHGGKIRIWTARRLQILPR
jgi:hypothetical protein